MSGGTLNGVRFALDDVREAAAEFHAARERLAAARDALAAVVRDAAPHTTEIALAEAARVQRVTIRAWKAEADR